MSSAPPTEQTLLFELRSPTTSLEAKQASISTALSLPSSSSSLASTVRDWMLDQLLRALKAPNSAQSALYTDERWWALLARAVRVAPAGSATSTPQTLPVLAHFVSAYSARAQPSPELVRSVGAVWAKLASTGLRKATVDGALEAYAHLLNATALVVARGGTDLGEWEVLVLVWLKTMRTIVDPNKAGKKIPTHTLSLMPTLLRLLSSLPPASDSPLTSSILETVQYGLFNLDNLRRALARESYNAGTSASAAPAKDETEGAAGELLQALRSAMSEDGRLTAHVLQALPQFFALYHTALESHATTLFPLPSRTNFPTPSAARSALEIHSLQKRRALAASWVRGTASLIRWSEVKVESRAECMARTVEEVERADLYREGKENGWTGVLEQVVEGAVSRLGRNVDERDGLMALMGATLRLSFAAIESALPAVLKTLAASSPASEGAQSSATFLESLLDFHAKSLLLPDLVKLLGNALASDGARENNLLTTHTFAASLGKALGALVGSTVPSTWTTLVASIEADLGLGANAAAALEGEEPSPSKKKRKMAASADVKSASAAARLRLLALFASALPLPLPLELFASFDKEHGQRALKELAKGKGKAKEQDRVAREALGVRYAIVERVRTAGEEMEEWELPEKRVSGLVELVRSAEEGATVVQVCRTLLQSLSPSTSAEAAQPVLEAILSRMRRTDVAWNGLLRGMRSEELATALWDLIARRWIVAFDLLASDELLARLAGIITDSITTSIGASITFSSTTARMLRRADIWELTRLQPHLRQALLSKVSLSGLSTPSAMLEALEASKPPKALRAIGVQEVKGVVGSFEAYAALLPVEYAGRALCGQLIEQAVSLDVWLTGGKTDLGEEERASAQETLRRFVLLALGNRTSVLADAPAVLAHLVKNTVASSASLVEATIELYAHFARSIAGNPAGVKPYLDAFEKPLAGMKRFKKAVGTLGCEELAFFALCEALASNLPARASLQDESFASLEELVQSAAKPFEKALGYATEAVAADASVAVELADTIRATQAFWQLRDYLSLDGKDHEQLELFASFAQTTLGALLSQSVLTGDARELAAREAMLDLLTFRVARLRVISDKEKMDTLPFETLVACHVAFRQALGAQGAKSLERALKRASAAATLREYDAALKAVSGSIAAAVAADAELSETLKVLGPALQVISTLLRDGPEGSSRLSGACLSELLRHISFFLLQHAPGSEAQCTGEQVAQTFALVSRFVEGVAAERPMLFGRADVGAALGLVSRIAQPTPSSAYAAEAVPTTSQTSSELFLALTGIVGHLVRHHKEHLTQLFPQLVHAISALLAILRRAGYGTTGSLVSSTEEDGAVVEVITVANLGRKAEREARETFPFWAWEGGASALGRDEAKAVSRVLSSLTTKTASNSHGKHGKKDSALISLSAPLSKHAPFLLLAYLRSAVHALAPIPSAIRNELQGGWHEVMDSVGKWEREALMKGFLGEAEGAERGVLRGMWRGWESGRYKG